jgi:flagellin-like hook-associated protein FlgL
MQDLAAQSQDTSVSAEDAAKIKKEFEVLVKSLIEVSNKEYNGVKLFDGNPRQIASLSLDLQGVNLSGKTYAKVVQSDIGTTEGAQQAQKDIASALKQLARDRQAVDSSNASINQSAHTVISFTDVKESSDAMKSAQSASSEFILNGEVALAAQANLSLDPQRTIQLLH